jgi:hypothetical protein
MFRAPGRLSALLVLLVSAACGGGGGGGGNGTPSPSPNALSSPTDFRIVQQRVNWTSNEVQLAWAGNGPSYRVYAASTPRGSDLLTLDTTATSYTWMAPRTASVFYVRVVAVRGGETSTSSPELPVFTLDLRNVVDALFFRSGPMADVPDTAFSNPPVFMWPDGRNLSVFVSNEAGETPRASAQTFTGDYGNLSGGRVTATVQTTSDDLRSWVLETMPLFTIGIRVNISACGGPNILACANYGPNPLSSGPDRSLVELNSPGAPTAVSHELGHSYGLGHVHVTGAVRAELNFMMNPALLSQQMTEPERTAIATAWDMGLRRGMRRNDALAAGLVLPYPNPSATPASAFPASRDEIKCKIVDGATKSSIR